MINAYDNRFPLVHESYRFFDSKAAYFISYSDTCYSCDVSYRFVVRTKNNEYKESPTRVTCYFLKTKNKWMLYDFVIGSELLTDADVAAGLM